MVTILLALLAIPGVLALGFIGAELYAEYLQRKGKNPFN
jgi:hypothetical protein